MCLLAVATLANGFAALLVIMLFGSVGLMVSGPGTKVLVAREVPVSQQGLAFGIQMSAIPFAALLGGLAVPTIGLTVGWRWAFAGAVLIPLLGAVTLPRDRAAVAATTPRPAGFGHVDFRPLIVLGIAAVIGAAAATTTASFFVVTGTEAGFSEGVAGVMLSVVSGLVIVLRIGFGRVASRWESAHPYAVAGLFVVATGGYLLLALGLKALFPIGAFLALSFGWAWTGLLVYTVVLHHPTAPGLASSVIVGAMNLGSVLGPLVFGLAIERLTDSAAFAIIGAGTLVAAGASRLGIERLSRETAPESLRTVPAPIATAPTTDRATAAASPPCRTCAVKRSNLPGTCTTMRSTRGRSCGQMVVSTNRRRDLRSVGRVVDHLPGHQRLHGPCCRVVAARRL